MPRTTSGGKCELCGRSYRKSGMTTHLRSCLARHARAGGGANADRAVGVDTGAPGRSIHLIVEDTYRPEYWLHLAVPARATLNHLDAYLRNVWLECCLHLSAFRIGRDYYDYIIFDDDDDDGFFALLDEMQGIRHADMNVAVATVAPPGTRFRHEYDFGTTTELVLRSVAEIADPVTNANAGDGDGAAAAPAAGGANRDSPGAIRLLARNDAPAIICAFCGAPATGVSPGPDDWIAMTAGVCEACVPRLESEDYLLPIVNSPRSGVCGYTGAPVGIIYDDDERWPEDEGEADNE